MTAGADALALLAIGGLSGHGLAMLAFTVIVFATFASDRVPIASVCLAILVVVPLFFAALPLADASGSVIDSGRFFSGFGHPALITICSLMILGHALVVTGALDPVARRLASLVAARPRLALAAVLVGVMLVSGFVNDTPVVVLMIPLLLAATARAKVAPAGVLMPMNFAVLIGGMSTSIGTSTNLIVISIAASLGLAPFGMLDFYGLVAVAAVPALLYLWLIAPLLLRSVPVPAAMVSEEAFDAELHLEAESRFVNRELREALAATGGRMRIVDLRDAEGRQRSRLPTMKLRAGDRFVLQDTVPNLKEFEGLLGASLHGVADIEALAAAPVDPVDPDAAAAAEAGEKQSPRDADAIVARLVITPQSPMVGRSVSDHRIAERYRLVVVGVKPARSTILPSRAAPKASRTVADRALAVGDVLLVQGRVAAIQDAQRDNIGALLDDQLVLPRRHKAPTALLTMAVVVSLAAFKIVPIAIAALAGVLFLLAMRTLAFGELAAALSVKVVLIVAASFALGDALTVTGATQWLAVQLVSATGALEPRWILVLLMVLMGALTNFVSNNASAAIGTPLAVELARQLGVAPEPYVLAVLFGCNLCYVTPMGYQTNLLVMNAAGYRFGDFVRVGGPLFVIMGAVLSAMLMWRYSL